MTLLRQHFINRLKTRGLSEKTITNYVSVVRQVTGHYRCSPLELTGEQIERWRLFLLTEKKHSPSTVNLSMNALRTFFHLMQPGVKRTGCFYRMKTPKHLPTVLSREEVERLIVVVVNLKHRVILMLLYSCGLRLSECIDLKPVQSERTLAGSLFPCRFHRSFGTQPVCAEKQERFLQHSVQGSSRDAAYSCRERKIPRSNYRFYSGAAYLGTESYGSSAPALCCSRRRVEH
jgi:site-specific recombinase XerC